jgi:hypothetical protein
VGDQRELALDLVSRERGFAFAHPVRQQVVRVLAVVREPKRNAREQREHGGRQRALGVRREDDGGVEAAALEIRGEFRH